jgi:predicted extracellular nuclease
MKKVSLLSLSLLSAFTMNAQNCSELFISEYVEGWSNNKAIELFNPTNETIEVE